MFKFYWGQNPIEELLAKLGVASVVFSIVCFVIATVFPVVSNFFSIAGGIGILFCCLIGALNRNGFLS